MMDPTAFTGATILPFPAPDTAKAMMGETLARQWTNARLAEMTEQLASAALDGANALRLMQDGKDLAQDHNIYTGDTLRALVAASLCTILLMGSHERERALAGAMYQWLEKVPQ